MSPSFMPRRRRRRREPDPVVIIDGDDPDWQRLVEELDWAIAQTRCAYKTVKPNPRYL